MYVAALALLAGAQGFAPPRPHCPRAPLQPPAPHRASVRLPEAVMLDFSSDSVADAFFGIAFFALLSSSGILFLKSTFYESQGTDSILEDDPFTGIGQRLPFSKPRMTEVEAVRRAEEVSTRLREAIQEREYPEALALKRELAELMVDYRLDYNIDDAELPPGTALQLPDEGQPRDSPKEAE